MHHLIISRFSTMRRIHQQWPPNTFKSSLAELASVSISFPNYRPVHCSFLSPQLTPPACSLWGANPRWTGSFHTSELDFLMMRYYLWRPSAKVCLDPYGARRKCFLPPISLIIPTLKACLSRYRSIRDEHALSASELSALQPFPTPETVIMDFLVFFNAGEKIGAAESEKKKKKAPQIEVDVDMNRSCLSDLDIAGGWSVEEIEKSFCAHLQGHYTPQRSLKGEIKKKFLFIWELYWRVQKK